MKAVLLSCFLLLFGAAPQSGPSMAAGPSYKTIEVNERRISSIERKVRNAAVRVSKPLSGHGSGSLIKYKDLQLVQITQ